MKILLIEENDDLAFQYAEALKRKYKFVHQVYRVKNTKRAEQILTEARFGGFTEKICLFGQIIHEPERALEMIKIINNPKRPKTTR